MVPSLKMQESGLRKTGLEFCNHQILFQQKKALPVKQEIFFSTLHLFLF
jgi:hypothetical protein